MSIQMRKLTTIITTIILAIIVVGFSLSQRNLIAETRLGGTYAFPEDGGTGTSTKPTTNSILIGKSTGVYDVKTLTAGSNITITNSGNTLTIASSGGGGGGSGNVATSSAETSTYIPFWTSTAGTPALLSGGESTLTYDSTLNKLTISNASTTNISNSGYIKGSGAGKLDLNYNTNGFAFSNDNGTFGDVYGIIENSQIEFAWQSAGIIIDTTGLTLNGNALTFIRGTDLRYEGATANTVPYWDGTKDLTSSAVTPTELGYLSGVTSAIQTQLGTKYTRSINSISTNTSAGSTARTDYIYFSSNTITVTLPTAVSNTNIYTIKNTGVGVVTVDTTSAQTIDGSLTIDIAPEDSVDIVSNNSNWFII